MIFTERFRNAVAASNFVKELDNGRIILDNSENSYWNGCFVAGLYYGALRRVPARARSPLAFGSAIHVGIESFLKGEPKWLDRALAEAATNGLDNMFDPKRTSDKVEELLTSYVMEYSRKASMRFNILESQGVPLVEKSFSVPLGTIQANYKGQLRTFEVIWLGKIDVLSLYDAKICPVDHKTTSVMGDKFVDDKLRSSQMLGYTYAARHLSETAFDNLPVYGVRINALAQRTGGFEFKIFDIPVAQWKVDEWKAGTLLSLKQDIEKVDSFLANGVAAPIRDHCVTKYGRCPYFDACDCMPKMRDGMIFDDEIYAISNWSPLGE